MAKVCRSSKTPSVTHENATFFNEINDKKEVSIEEKIGVIHPGLSKRGITKRNKNVGLPTHDSYGVSEALVMLVTTLLTGSAILSSLPSDPGQVSPAQVAAVSHGKIILGHHVHHKSRGWLKQAARVKPMVKLYSRLDISAYKELGLQTNKQLCLEAST